MSPTPDGRLIAFSFRNSEMALRSFTVDGSKLNPLPGAQPYNHPDPTWTVRDPAVMTFAGRHWMIATRAPRSNYLGDCSAVQIAVTDDLLSWTHYIDVDCGLLGANRVWAPEWYVEPNGTVWLYASVSFDGASTFAIYAARATDSTLTSWSTWSKVGDLGNAYDANPTRQDDGSIVLMYAGVTDHVIHRARSTNGPAGPFTPEGATVGSTDNVEAPELVALPGGRWRLCYDRYMASQLAYRESDGSLDSWGPEVELSYPFSDMRHVGYLWMTAGEWAAFRAHPRRVTTWSTAPNNPPTGTSPGVLTFGGSAGDPDMWSSGLPTHLVAPEAGIYSLQVQIGWAANSTGQRSCAFRVNGGGWNFLDSKNASAGGFGSEQCGLAGGVHLAAQDYVEIGALQNSGGAVAVNTCAATLTRVASA
jgi:hypothetical protein